jgi:hypothetical protein
MAFAEDNGACTCSRCGRSTTPRGGNPPRYCAVCGQRLTPLHDEVQRALASGPRTPGMAMAALFLGALSLIPMWGLFLGLIAVALGIKVRDRIDRSRGTLRGRGLAVAGITLGAIGCLISLLVCLRLV